MNKIYIYATKTIYLILTILNLKKKIISKIKFNLGLNNILILRQKYESVQYINETECQVFSQNGEDGIIDYLITKLKIFKPNFIEIGVGTYIEANTRFLYDRFYPKGLIIDCEKDLENKVSSNINLWKGDLKILEVFVTQKNINNLLIKNCNFNVDIFSLDIDGIDYWILEKINSINPKIIIAEYNPTFGHVLEVTVPNIINFDRKKYHYSQLCYGMSLVALIKLMKNKNYYFIGSNSSCNNAFFISNDFNKNKYFTNLTVKNLSDYTDSNIRESRDINNKLNFLTGRKKLNEIKNCQVIDLSKETRPLVTISSLI